MAEETKVGRVSDYFAKVGVAGIDVTKTIKVGDQIHIKGHTTDLAQAVESIQVEHETVLKAGPKPKIGIKVSGRCRHGDYVYVVKK